jgi:SCY1-like protein 1
MDAVETDTAIHIMTERVRPIQGGLLSGWAGKGEKEQEDWLIWGLHRISVCLIINNLILCYAITCYGHVFADCNSFWPVGW